jgi:hypothetical protein
MMLQVFQWSDFEHFSEMSAQMRKAKGKKQKR